MTKQELLNKVSISRKGYGTYDVTTEFRGKNYSCTSNDTMAYDRIKSNDSMSEYRSEFGYTYKQALEAFYDDCKRINNLGEYAY